MKKIEDYLTVIEVAEKMKFKERTILKWCNNGDLTHCKVGGKIRILESDVVALIEQGRAY